MINLGHEKDFIQYTGTSTYDGVQTAVYKVVLENITAMIVQVDETNESHTISISTSNLAITLPTAGRATMIDGHADERSIATYVIPRLHILLARLLTCALIDKDDAALNIDL